MTSKLRLLLGMIVTCMVMLTACASPHISIYNLTWEAVDGSHANGTIEVAASIRSGSTFYWNYQQADALAVRRCRAWDYRGAEVFGQTMQRCTSYYQGSNNCALWQYSRRYQCITNVSAELSN
ncbi:MAG: YecR family lipoprotein [Eikenella corrodens]|uniref:YecR family lipoprotein n=1 Tax=Eikenella corrodens TaxID=539 RepID=UPI00361C59F7